MHCATCDWTLAEDYVRGIACIHSCRRPSTVCGNCDSGSIFSSITKRQLGTSSEENVSKCKATRQPDGRTKITKRASEQAKKVKWEGRKRKEGFEFRNSILLLISHSCLWLPQHETIPERLRTRMDMDRRTMRRYVLKYCRRMRVAAVVVTARFTFCITCTYPIPTNEEKKS